MNPGGNEEKRADSEIWSFRFSGPEFHDVNSHQFTAVSLEQNIPYKFEFVPMGDSPERVSIQIGPFSETFILEREFSRYWNLKILYLGLFRKQIF